MRVIESRLDSYGGDSKMAILRDGTQLPVSQSGFAPLPMVLSTGTQDARRPEYSAHLEKTGLWLGNGKSLPQRG